jgi:transposase
MAHSEGFVGLDVGKFEIFVFISKTGAAFSVPNTPTGHVRLQNRLGMPVGQIIALEPTGGYEWAVWEMLDTAGYDVRQVSSAHVRAFSRATGALAKTDPIDARLIAEFIAFRPQSGRRLPAGNLRLLNVLSAKRRQLVELRKRLKCQIKQHQSTKLTDMDDELLRLLSHQISILDEEIQIKIKGDPQMSQQSRILRSIPGIGPVLCAALIGEMPELGTIGDKQIAALAGVAPINRDSGRMDGRRSIKGGRYIIRSLLYQAALVASTHNKSLKVFAARLKGNGKPHKVVLIAVARKLLTIANALVAKNQLWCAS